MPASLWKEDCGSNQRTNVQLAGVNWSTARFSFPEVVWMFLRRVNWCISNHLKYLWILGWLQWTKYTPEKEHNPHWLDASPAVGSHFQKVTDSHAQPDPSSIAQQDVQDDLIPPALCEVWQQVHEEQLQSPNCTSWNECIYNIVISSVIVI